MAIFRHAGSINAMMARKTGTTRRSSRTCRPGMPAKMPAQLVNNMNNIDLNRFIELFETDRKTDTILFLKAGFSEIILPLITERGDDSIYIAISGMDVNNVEEIKYSSNCLLNPATMDFIDNVKIITHGKGFNRMMVMDDDPVMVKMALGVAAVLGDIYLLLPVPEEVIIDLTATINFKSLRIHGINISPAP